MWLLEWLETICLPDWYTCILVNQNHKKTYLMISQRRLQQSQHITFQNDLQRNCLFCEMFVVLVKILEEDISLKMATELQSTLLCSCCWETTSDSHGTIMRISYYISFHTTFLLERSIIKFNLVCRNLIIRCWILWISSYCYLLPST